MLKKCRFIPRLETDRLILREITEADTEDLRQWLGLDKVHAFWGCPASRDEKTRSSCFAPPAPCPPQAVPRFHLGDGAHRRRRVIGTI